jgi:hypothetical protein
MRMEPDPEELCEINDEIFGAFSLMADRQSCDAFISCLRSHFERSYENSMESPDTIQYFSPSIQREMRLSRFIDCGAYIGDTLESLVRLGELEEYAGFEWLSVSGSLGCKTLRFASVAGGHAQLISRLRACEITSSNNVNCELN